MKWILKINNKFLLILNLITWRRFRKNRISIASLGSITLLDTNDDNYLIKNKNINNTNAENEIFQWNKITWKIINWIEIIK